jgi:ketosteroid isomerase-like protein
MQYISLEGCEPGSGKLEVHRVGAIVQSIETENLELVKSLLTAFVRGDIAAIRRKLTDDVIFHFPGGNQFSGDYKGIDAALSLLGRVYQWTSGDMKIRMHDVLANEQHGVLLYTVTARHGERRISYRYINLYHFRDGQVSEVWGVPQEAPGFDEFYSE